MSKTEITPKMAQEILANIKPGSETPETSYSAALGGSPEPYASIAVTDLARILDKPNAQAVELHLASAPYSRGSNASAQDPSEHTVQVYTDRLRAKAEGQEPQIAYARAI